MALFGKKDEGSAVADAPAPQLEALKTKYQSVLNMIQRVGARLENVHIKEGKLLIRAEAPSEQVKNQIWEQIKLTNPNWSSDLLADIAVRPGQGGVPAAEVAPPTRSYTVQAGDTLSKISKQFYGDANEYMKIFEANRDQLKDPDRIKPGQVLKIPS